MASWLWPLELFLSHSTLSWIRHPFYFSLLLFGAVWSGLLEKHTTYVDRFFFSFSTLRASVHSKMGWGLVSSTCTSLLLRFFSLFCLICRPFSVYLHFIPRICMRTNCSLSLHTSIYIYISGENQVFWSLESVGTPSLEHHSSVGWLFALIFVIISICFVITFVFLSPFLLLSTYWLLFPIVTLLLLLHINLPPPPPPPPPPLPPLPFRVFSQPPSLETRHLSKIFWGNHQISFVHLISTYLCFFFFTWGGKRWRRRRWCVCVRMVQRHAWLSERETLQKKLSNSPIHPSSLPLSHVMYSFTYLPTYLPYPSLHTILFFSPPFLFISLCVRARCCFLSPARARARVCVCVSGYRLLASYYGGSIVERSGGVLVRCGAFRNQRGGAASRSRSR
ncbi:hypothetical protein DM02DRAFT_169678 [Periconia macrospinosa]|uniref:Uncharacterized protein n=1 Tax=Periconia macrospinosa TaxID=97972 RepID=A0A2V1DA95_9PLEO|nr:hypothetical protein DM02DRAFT_169678 [Periconia macrospinosa]